MSTDNEIAESELKATEGIENICSRQGVTGGAVRSSRVVGQASDNLGKGGGLPPSGPSRLGATRGGARANPPRGMPAMDDFDDFAAFAAPKGAGKGRRGEAEAARRGGGLLPTISLPLLTPVWTTGKSAKPWAPRPRSHLLVRLIQSPPRARWRARAPQTVCWWSRIRPTPRLRGALMGPVTPGPLKGTGAQPLPVDGALGLNARAVDRTQLAALKANPTDARTLANFAKGLAPTDVEILRVTKAPGTDVSLKAILDSGSPVMGLLLRGSGDVSDVILTGVAALVLISLSRATCSGPAFVGGWVSVWTPRAELPGAVLFVGSRAGCANALRGGIKEGRRLVACLKDKGGAELNALVMDVRRSLPKLTAAVVEERVALLQNCLCQLANCWVAQLANPDSPVPKKVVLDVLEGLHSGRESVLWKKLAALGFARLAVWAPGITEDVDDSLQVMAHQDAYVCIGFSKMTLPQVTSDSLSEAAAGWCEEMPVPSGINFFPWEALKPFQAFSASRLVQEPPKLHLAPPRVSADSRHRCADPAAHRRLLAALHWARRRALHEGDQEKDPERRIREHPIAGELGLWMAAIWRGEAMEMGENLAEAARLAQDVATLTFWGLPHYFQPFIDHDKDCCPGCKHPFHLPALLLRVRRDGDKDRFPMVTSEAMSVLSPFFDACIRALREDLRMGVQALGGPVHLRPTEFAHELLPPEARAAGFSLEDMLVACWDATKATDSATNFRVDSQVELLVGILDHAREAGAQFLPHQAEAMRACLQVLKVRRKLRIDKDARLDLPGDPIGGSDWSAKTPEEAAQGIADALRSGGWSVAAVDCEPSVWEAPRSAVCRPSDFVFPARDLMQDMADHPEATQLTKRLVDVVTPILDGPGPFLLQSPPGTGKSFCIPSICAIKKFSLVLVTTPKNALNLQVYNDLLALGEEWPEVLGPVGLLQGGEHPDPEGRPPLHRLRVAVGSELFISQAIERMEEYCRSVEDPPEYAVIFDEIGMISPERTKVLSRALKSPFARVVMMGAGTRADKLIARIPATRLGEWATDRYVPPITTVPHRDHRPVLERFHLDTGAQLPSYTVIVFRDNVAECVKMAEKHRLEFEEDQVIACHSGMSLEDSLAMVSKPTAQRRVIFANPVIETGFNVGCALLVAYPERTIHKWDCFRSCAVRIMGVMSPEEAAQLAARAGRSEALKLVSEAHFLQLPKGATNFHSASTPPSCRSVLEGATLFEREEGVVDDLLSFGRALGWTHNPVETAFTLAQARWPRKDVKFASMGSCLAAAFASLGVVSAGDEVVLDDSGWGTLLLGAWCDREAQWFPEPWDKSDPNPLLHEDYSLQPLSMALQVWVWRAPRESWRSSERLNLLLKLAQVLGMDPDQVLDALYSTGEAVEGSLQWLVDAAPWNLFRFEGRGWVSVYRPWDSFSCSTVASFPLGVVALIPGRTVNYTSTERSFRVGAIITIAECVPPSLSGCVCVPFRTDGSRLDFVSPFGIGSTGELLELHGVPGPRETFLDGAQAYFEEWEELEAMEGVGLTRKPQSLGDGGSFVLLILLLSICFTPSGYEAAVELWWDDARGRPSELPPRVRVFAHVSAREILKVVRACRNPFHNVFGDDALVVYATPYHGLASRFCAHLLGFREHAPPPRPEWADFGLDPASPIPMVRRRPFLGDADVLAPPTLCSAVLPADLLPRTTKSVTTPLVKALGGSVGIPEGARWNFINSPYEIRLHGELEPATRSSMLLEMDSQLGKPSPLPLSFAGTIEVKRVPYLRYSTVVRQLGPLAATITGLDSCGPDQACEATWMFDDRGRPLPNPRSLDPLLHLLHVAYPASREATLGMTAEERRALVGARSHVVFDPARASMLRFLTRFLRESGVPVQRLKRSDVGRQWVPLAVEGALHTTSRNGVGTIGLGRDDLPAGGATPAARVSLSQSIRRFFQACSILHPHRCHKPRIPTTEEVAARADPWVACVPASLCARASAEIQLRLRGTCFQMSTGDMTPDVPLDAAWDEEDDLFRAWHLETW
jgi:hypothetical protein